MSGHSKWSTIKRKKGKMDAQRGKIFSKLIKEITVAARQGGGDLNANPRLRQAVQSAKTANMPQDNIERAIKKGTGELPGVTYEEVVYEGYGPGGMALLVEVATDNKNRTVADIRHILSKRNGHLGETGSVAWMFEQRGFIVVGKEACDEDQLLAVVLEAGAEDMELEGDAYEITTAPNDFEAVKQALDEHKIPYTLAELTKTPQSIVKLEGKTAEQALTLMEDLEDHEDVQHVYSNFDIDESIMEKMGS
ncbi:MAG: transcriptional regulator [candidate division Zixibacteria bacterium SM23_81]|nr:MAG: transcriptional regulator [candidate division Zixibacteria bacterium SM23_81]